MLYGVLAHARHIFRATGESLARCLPIANAPLMNLCIASKVKLGLDQGLGLETATFSSHTYGSCGNGEAFVVQPSGHDGLLLFGPRTAGYRRDVVVFAVPDRAAREASSSFSDGHSVCEGRTARASPKQAYGRGGRVTFTDTLGIIIQQLI